MLLPVVFRIVYMDSVTYPCFGVRMGLCGASCARILCGYRWSVTRCYMVTRSAESIVAGGTFITSWRLPAFTGRVG